MTAKDKILVDGKPIDIDISADLTIQDVSDDMDRVAALMGYWGAIWAAAEEEKLNMDAHYRIWKAQQTKTIMSKDHKLALPKIAALIEADSNFKLLKASQARAVKNVIIAKSHFESFRVKASILQSKGAFLRAEHDATSMTTKKTTQPQKTEEKITIEDKENAARDAISKTRGE